MLMIDEDKLTNGIIRQIGEVYGISENKYNMCNSEGYYAYIEEVISKLQEDTEVELDYIVECIGQKN